MHPHANTRTHRQKAAKRAAASFREHTEFTEDDGAVRWKNLAAAALVAVLDRCPRLPLTDLDPALLNAITTAMFEDGTRGAETPNMAERPVAGADLKQDTTGAATEMNPMVTKAPAPVDSPVKAGTSGAPGNGGMLWHNALQSLATNHAAAGGCAAWLPSAQEDQTSRAKAGHLVLLTASSKMALTSAFLLPPPPAQSDLAELAVVFSWNESIGETEAVVICRHDTAAATVATNGGFREGQVSVETALVRRCIDEIVCSFSRKVEEASAAPAVDLSIHAPDDERSSIAGSARGSHKAGTGQSARARGRRLRPLQRPGRR